MGADDDFSTPAETTSDPSAVQPETADGTATRDTVRETSEVEEVAK